MSGIDYGHRSSTCPLWRSQISRLSVSPMKQKIMRRRGGVLRPSTINSATTVDISPPTIRPRTRQDIFALPTEYYHQSSFDHNYLYTSPLLAAVASFSLITNILDLSL